MNNVYVHFVLAQPKSCQFLSGKNDLFSPSLLCNSGQKIHFCPPQAAVNSVDPRKNGRKWFIYSFLIQERSHGFFDIDQKNHHYFQYSYNLKKTLLDIITIQEW